MNGFRFFPIHIVIKDLSFMIVYLVIMKYNLTNETYLPETLGNFPGASTMTWWNIISVTIVYNVIPMLISLAFYYPIVYGLKRLIVHKQVRLIFTGFVLTLTTPIFYLIMNNWTLNGFYQLPAELIAWTLCFLLSMGFYYLTNKTEYGNEEPLESIG